MIIGITGTDGSGKGAVVDYLVSKKDFVHYSSRELIISEIKLRDLTVSRAQMRLVANDMRKTKGLDVIVATALNKMRKDGVKDAVIESKLYVSSFLSLRNARDKTMLLLIDNLIFLFMNPMKDWS